ncbi:MAG: hypothetical protein FD123_2985 [Bacteroidetes bacterium]|nr:MAG: hypothetical protein FD123_2985 [Bacteroidota bacterium]
MMIKPVESQVRILFYLHSMKRLLPLLLLATLSSCFHKDVMNDVADDVKYATVYSGKEGKIAITFEEIFQATSKKSGGGFTSISGYAEYRLTSYNIENGNVMARVELGEGRDKNETAILGTTEGKLWMFSFSEELGLHYRNPGTLDVLATQKQLMEKPGMKGLALSKPEWTRISSFYGFDPVSGRIMFTDQQGFKYYLDPNTFAVEKTEAEIKDHNWSRSVTSNNGDLGYEKNVSMKGDPRKTLEYENSKRSQPHSFLFAKLVLDENPFRGSAEIKPLYDSLARRIDSLDKRMKELAAADPQIADERLHYFQLPDKLREMKREWEEINRSIGNEKYQLQRWEKDGDYHRSYLLADEKNSLLVWSASSVGDTCRALVSKMKLNPDSSFAQAWQIKLDEFYYDPSKADNAGAFETVFSDGNPEFDYQWFRCLDNKLVFISQLRMACIDMKTGKLLWSHQL